MTHAKISVKTKQIYSSLYRGLLAGLLLGGLAACNTGGSAKGDILSEDFVIAESQGEKVTNKDLGPRFMRQLEQIKRQLNQQQFMAARGILREKTDGKAGRANTKFNIPIPKKDVNIADDDPSRGNADAPVTLVEFSDYACYYCSKVNPTLGQLFKEYQGKIRHVFKDLPIISKASPKAAEAAQCVHKIQPDLFWQYQQALFQNRKQLQPAALKKYAQNLGVDAGAFNTCLSNGEMKEKVKANMKEGRRLGVSGTPAVFINGIYISGALPYSEFKRMIEEELSL